MSNAVVKALEHVGVSVESSEPSLNIRCLKDVRPERIEWLWYPYIPLAKVTMLDGDPSAGKGWLSCAIATGVAAGRGLYGTEPTTPGNVLMLAAEDGLSDTLRPRLDSMNADISRIFAFGEPFTLDARGVMQLAEAIATYEPRLVTIDPLFCFVGSKVDIHRANEARPVMAELTRLAEQFRCAILVVRHLNKGGNQKAIYRGLGSIDYVAAVRSALVAGADPDDKGRRAIVHTKSNLAPLGSAVGYTITNDGRFLWTGESNLTAERILSIGDGNESTGGARLEAEDFLRSLLADGPIAAKEAQREAREAGISGATLRRAKESIGVRSVKHGGEFGGPREWLWELTDEGVQ
ncbi:MAG: AAA family ATPase [Acidobacteria bacterium]|nr:AAA family ATPase [Acidobacteriota bacterium]MCW5969428.1 AAA family ATPase [Blastocatellales bacterium]